jgi:hypothetical protein
MSNVNPNQRVVQQMTTPAAASQIPDALSINAADDLASDDEFESSALLNPMESKDEEKRFLPAWLKRKRYVSLVSAGGVVIIAAVILGALGVTGYLTGDGNRSGVPQDGVSYRLPSRYHLRVFRLICAYILRIGRLELIVAAVSSVVSDSSRRNRVQLGRQLQESS